MAEFKGTSDKNELDTKDWKRYFRNLLLFSSPAILAVLVALQGFITNDNFLPSKEQVIFAAGAGYSAILSSAIDLFQKWKNAV